MQYQEIRKAVRRTDISFIVGIFCVTFATAFLLGFSWQGLVAAAATIVAGSMLISERIRQERCRQRQVAHEKQVAEILALIKQQEEARQKQQQEEARRHLGELLFQERFSSGEARLGIWKQVAELNDLPEDERRKALSWLEAQQEAEKVQKESWMLTHRELTEIRVGVRSYKCLTLLMKNSSEQEKELTLFEPMSSAFEDFLDLTPGDEVEFFALCQIPMGLLLAQPDWTSFLIPCKEA